MGSGGPGTADDDQRVHKAAYVAQQIKDEFAKGFNFGGENDSETLTTNQDIISKAAAELMSAQLNGASALEIAALEGQLTSLTENLDLKTAEYLQNHDGRNSLEEYEYQEDKKAELLAKEREIEEEIETFENELKQSLMEDEIDRNLAATAAAVEKREAEAKKVAAAKKEQAAKEKAQKALDLKNKQLANEQFVGTDSGLDDVDMNLIDPTPQSTMPQGSPGQINPYDPSQSTVLGKPGIDNMDDLLGGIDLDNPDNVVDSSMPSNLGDTGANMDNMTGATRDLVDPNVNIDEFAMPTAN